MAQTKRKRRTKHRGNAAGANRGARPHRPQAHRGGTEEGRRPPRRQTRQRKPPSWNAAALKSRAMAVILFVARVKFGVLGTERHVDLPERCSWPAMAMILYTPLAYFTDRGSTTASRRASRRRSPDGGALADRRPGPGEHLDRARRQREKALLIDPGDEPDTHRPRRSKSSARTPEAILITHCHFDHVGAVAEMARRTQAPRLLPRGRGLHPREHQRLRALPGLRAVRVLLARADGQATATSCSSPASRSTSSARPATARTT